jgi:hypothetical protein
MWLPDHRALYTAELKDNRMRLGREGSSLRPSSYRARLKGPAADAYDAKMLRRERDQLAVELHGNNMRVWTPSLIARSIAYYPLTTSWMHAVEVGQRRLASRPTTLKVLRMMSEQQPVVEHERGEHISVYIYDQTYEWVWHAKAWRRQAVEGVDAHGMPMAISHEVYINSVRVHLPSSIGNLSFADRAKIAANHGSPYTEDYNHLFDFLRVCVC